MRETFLPPTASSGNSSATGEPQFYGVYRYSLGDTIAGRFYVHERLAGGFGHVYLCYDQEQDYFVALKTFKLSEATLTDPHVLLRLRREVELWIALGQHPHIVECFSLELLDNLPFIRLEWVADTDHLCAHYASHHEQGPHFLDWYARLGQRVLPLRKAHANRNRLSQGTSLASWLERKQTLSPKRAIQIALELCAGLAHAQAIHPGLVHRDLKPANVLLNEQLCAKVSDFGIAVVAQDVLDPDRPFGTPAYMAPEQWAGGALDPRADIYAIGCMLFEMVTGTPPFVTSISSVPERRASLRWQHEHAAPPFLPRTLPTGLNALIQTCLQKDPDARFASIAALANALTACSLKLTGAAPHWSGNPRPMTVEEINQVGVTYFQLEKYALALAEFERARALDATYPNTYTNRGCVYHVLGQRDTALADYAQALRLGRRAINAKVRNNRGLLYLQNKEVKRALRDLNQAIEFDPDYANAYANRGLAYALIGDYDQALQDFAHTLHLHLKHVIARHNQSYLHHLRGDLPAALAGYTATLAQDPTFVPTYLNRSLLYQEIGRQAEADRDRTQFQRLLLVTSINRSEGKADFAWSRPDPQFVNGDSLEALIAQPLLAPLMEQRRWEKMRKPAQQQPTQRPLRALVHVKALKYADFLHESIQKRQNQGQRITQVTVDADVLQGDGQYRPYPTLQEWQLTIDEAAMKLMAASSLRTLDDLKGHILVLHNDEPDDLDYPLRIGNVH